MRHLPGYASREPDILFVAREHLHRLTTHRLEGPADLVVEVASPSTAHMDRTDKFDEYEQAGVREYWLLDPRPGQEPARFYQRDAQGRYQAVPPDATGRYHAAVLPGFWLHLAWLQQQPLPQTIDVLLEMIGEPYARYLIESIRQRGTFPDGETEG
jgi:Uma2 family endonuclease